MSDIVERLRARKLFPYVEGGNTLEREEFVNPDGPEAADLIESLQRDNEAMREALEQLESKARLGGDSLGNSPGFEACAKGFYYLADLARTTLKGLNQ